VNGKQHGKGTERRVNSSPFISAGNVATDTGKRLTLKNVVELGVFR
jgi:hypothetical protein